MPISFLFDLLYYLKHTCTHIKMLFYFIKLTNKMFPLFKIAQLLQQEQNLKHHYKTKDQV